MRYAIKDNIRVSALKGLDGCICECCKKPVKPFCGKININHFRHIRSADCDSWQEPITEWHLNWQNQFPENQREIIINKGGIRHRADILTQNKTVIEFQYSFISPREIGMREYFYDRMIWVFSGIEFRKNFNLYFNGITNIDFRGENILYTSFDKRIKFYIWNYVKKHIFACTKPVFIDFGTTYLYWINYRSTKLPRFRHSIPSGEFYDKEAGDYKTIYESRYLRFPIKLIRKDLFIKHYHWGNKLNKTS